MRDDYDVQCPCGARSSPSGELIHYHPRWALWGDLVAIGLYRLGFKHKDCGGCDRRREWLNRLSLALTRPLRR